MTGDELLPDPDYQGALDAMYESRTATGAADEALFEVINSKLAWRRPDDQ